MTMMNKDITRCGCGGTWRPHIVSGGSICDRCDTIDPNHDLIEYRKNQNAPQTTPQHNVKDYDSLRLEIETNCAEIDAHLAELETLAAGWALYPKAMRLLDCVHNNIVDIRKANQK